MKRAAPFIIASTVSLLSILVVAPVFANTDVEVSNNGEGSSTHVDVQTNTGNNTICINGKCTTTTGGNGTSHVCINGKCYDSDSGNLNVQSDDGHAKVDINNTGAVQPTEEATQSPEPTGEIHEPRLHLRTVPSVSPSITPEISKILSEHKKDIDKMRQQMEDHLARHQALLQQFFATLQSFLKSLHIF